MGNISNLTLKSSNDSNSRQVQDFFSIWEKTDLWCQLQYKSKAAYFINLSHNYISPQPIWRMLRVLHGGKKKSSQAWYPWLTYRLNNYVGIVSCSQKLKTELVYRSRPIYQLITSNFLVHPFLTIWTNNKSTHLATSSSYLKIYHISVKILTNNCLKTVSFSFLFLKFSLYSILP